MPAWDRECSFWRLEANRQLTMRGGASDAEIERVTAWRQMAAPANIELLDFYGVWRNGICSGMGGISVAEIRMALELTGVPVSQWQERAERLILLHAMIAELEQEKRA